jgi:hypothetical protein
MRYRLAADAVLLFHLTFIAFVLLGAALAARRPWVALIHVPVAAWGFFVELTGRGCPLTYAENYFRIRAGESGYGEGFVAHYLLPLIYPAGLTHHVQLVLAALVVLVNAVLYGRAILAWRRQR